VADVYEEGIDFYFKTLEYDGFKLRRDYEELSIPERDSIIFKSLGF